MDSAILADIPRMNPADEVASSGEAMLEALTSYRLRLLLEYARNPRSEHPDETLRLLLARARWFSDRDFRAAKAQADAPPAF